MSTEHNINDAIELLIVTCEDLFLTLNLEPSKWELETLNILRYSATYIDIYKNLFPSIDYSAFEQNEYMSMQDNGTVIDNLIKTLAEDVIKIPLDYINGEEISKGNIQHMTNLVQILTEVARIVSHKNYDNSDDVDKNNKCDDDYSDIHLQAFADHKIEESPISDNNINKPST